MLTALAMSLMMGAPVPVPEVSDAAAVQERMGGPVVVVGQLERVPMGKGGKQWHGTGVVLDDDTVIYVTYGVPPPGWETLMGSRVRVEGVLRPSLSEPEQSLLAPHLRIPGTPKKEERVISKKLAGQHLRLSGVARNAKGGAVLLVGKAPLYLGGMQRWPPEAEGKLVAVGATVVDKQYLPEAARNEKGEWSQSATGTQLVLESATWRVIEEPEKTR